MVDHRSPPAYAFSLSGLFLLLTWVAAAAVVSRMVSWTVTVILLCLPLPGFAYVTVVRAWYARQPGEGRPRSFPEEAGLVVGFLLINLISLAVAATELRFFLAGLR